MLWKDKNMSILGGLLVFVGLCLGFIATLATDDGLACISSIVAMVVGVVLLQVAERRVLASAIGENLTTELSNSTSKDNRD